MSLRIVTVPAASTSLRERFGAAAPHEPLCALGARDRAELDALLAAADDLDDLPGRWQAALLAAEAAQAGAPLPATGGGSCCAAT